MTDDILARWSLTSEELTEIVDANPSMRGLIFGYVAEHKLRKMLLSDKRIVDVRKYDNHDRKKKGDLSFTYKGTDITVEVKSLQTATITRAGGVCAARFQCDASDRRRIVLPNGESLNTTCLLVGEFDLLAVNLFAFRERWEFAFARNKDLPRSTYSKYTPEQQPYLLATLIAVTWPPQPPFKPDPFELLDEIVREKSR